jgi:hypothetical protein
MHLKFHHKFLYLFVISHINQTVIPSCIYELTAPFAINFKVLSNDFAFNIVKHASQKCNLTSGFRYDPFSGSAEQFSSIDLVLIRHKISN